MEHHHHHPPSSRQASDAIPQVAPPWWLYGGHEKELGDFLEKQLHHQHNLPFHDFQGPRAVLQEGVEGKSASLPQKLSCTTCGKAFARAANLKRHLLNHHDSTQVDSKTQHTCCICSKTFRRPVDLTRHLMVHKSNEHASLGVTPSAFGLEDVGKVNALGTFSVPKEEDQDAAYNGLLTEGLCIDLEREHLSSKARPLSMISLASGTTGSLFSSIDSNTIGSSRETTPLFALPEFGCEWARCRSSFKTHAALTRHVNNEHLWARPIDFRAKMTFEEDDELVEEPLDAVHLKKEKGVMEWSLEVGKTADSPEKGVFDFEKMKTVVYEGDVIEKRKRKCQEQLDEAMERKAKRAKKTSGGYAIPTPKTVETPSFPMVWEHSILPLLTTLIPKLSSPRHIISTTRGRNPSHRRINIITPIALSFSRKLIVGKHVRDLLPEPYKEKTSFVFSVGQVERTTWARGLTKEMPDDVCSARNPYAFTTPVMGDSIGIHGGDDFEESTATLGPCLTVDGGSYWLGNFHPFLEAYQSLGNVTVEHPSPQDRTRCMEGGHDAMSPYTNFKLGDLMVTSGLNLKTTRVSHDPYWEDLGKDPPLIVTDWALISSPSSRANILRRFPPDAQPPVAEPLITTPSPVTPGAAILSSGRTSGYQRGLICEIPAYVSGEENGTQKATREWFIEDPLDSEEAWIRGGIGVEGDSGAAVIDAESNDLVGQIWGRNRYWGAGPRHTFFTPIMDIFDDIQEKCGQETRPSLPQKRDEADRFPVYPSCRQCYDLRTYLDSRRSSRMSLQSMIMGPGEGGGDGDLTSIEAVSELATPRDYYTLPKSIGLGVEEAGASFYPFSPGVVSTPVMNDIKSPYAQTLDLDLPSNQLGDGKKRGAPHGLDVLRETGAYRVKRPRVEE